MRRSLLGRGTSQASLSNLATDERIFLVSRRLADYYFGKYMAKICECFPQCESGLHALLKG